MNSSFCRNIVNLHFLSGKYVIAAVKKCGLGLLHRFISPSIRGRCFGAYHSRKEVKKMKRNIVKESLSILYDLQSELHGHVEDTALQKLEEAINLLEAVNKNGGRIEKKKLLAILGKILDYIPTIVKIIDILSRSK
ncbi:MAG: hypothetical protein VB013_13405 [Anaerolineaceae bacterium]|nr:hypothetical protein [Anaerolineaceae bacterium]